MAPTDYLPVANEVPEFVAGWVMIAMALALLLLHFSDRLNRALALFLVLGGVEHIWAALDNTLAIQALAVSMLGYFRVATLFALVYLAARYAEHQGKFTVPRWAASLLLVLALAVETAYLLNHDLYAGGPGIETGPLGLAWPLRVLISAVVGLIFAREALVDGEAASSGDLLAAAAFSLEPAVWVLSPADWLLRGVTSAGGGQGEALEVAGSAPELLPVAMFGAAALIALFTAAWLLSRGRAVGERRVGASILVAGASGLLVVGLGETGLAWGDVVIGIWQLALPVLLGYAILRHQLFDIDAKLRWGISKSTLAAVFVAVFFVVSEGAQVFFQGFAGNEWIGVIAAGMLVFVITPLKRFADQVAEHAIPPDPQGRDREALYLAALEASLADGEISPEEERHLARLAEELGLGHTEVLDLRERAFGSSSGGSG